MAGHFIAGITFILWDRAQPLFLYSQAFVYITETLPERLDVRLRKGPQTTNVSHLVPLFYLRQENSESPHSHNTTSWSSAAAAVKTFPGSLAYRGKQTALIEEQTRQGFWLVICVVCTGKPGVSPPWSQGGSDSVGRAGGQMAAAY